MTKTFKTFTITKGNSNLETIITLFKKQAEIDKVPITQKLYDQAEELAKTITHRITLTQINSYEYEGNLGTSITFIFSYTKNPFLDPKTYTGFQISKRLKALESMVGSFLKTYDDQSNYENYSYSFITCPELNIIIATFNIL